MTTQFVLEIHFFTDDGSFRSVANICDNFGVPITLDLVIAIIIQEIDAYLLIQCQLAKWMPAIPDAVCQEVNRSLRTRPHGHRYRYRYRLY